MVSQVLGLAEVLGFEQPVQKRIGLTWPWTWFPTHPWFASLAGARRDRDVPAPPWPDLLITCGRKAAFLSLAIRRASQGKTQTIHIQDPKCDPQRFDLLVVPEHDRVRGDNVVVTKGAVHRVNAQRLAEGAAHFDALAANLPRPLVAVLIGGSNRNYRVTPEWIAGIAAELSGMCHATGCGLLVTPSRRTSPEAIAALRAGLATDPAQIWDGQGENPYFGYLGLADAIVVTADSISMVSEACCTGKPVLVARPPGKSARFDRFFGELLAQGFIRWFDGSLEIWPSHRLVDMDGIGRSIAARLGWGD